jgi:hypothetical protein
MTRVVQAAGRLIRSPNDVGVIALFDRRFLQTPYRDHLPRDWLAARAPPDWSAIRRASRSNSSAPLDPPNAAGHSTK